MPCGKYDGTCAKPERHLARLQTRTATILALHSEPHCRSHYTPHQHRRSHVRATRHLEPAHGRTALHPPLLGAATVLHCASSTTHPSIVEATPPVLLTIARHPHPGSLEPVVSAKHTSREPEEYVLVVNMCRLQYAMLGWPFQSLVSATQRKCLMINAADASFSSAADKPIADAPMQTRTPKSNRV